MPLTLAEADKYSTNQVLIGVAETSIDQNPLLGLLPFVPVRGNAAQYLRENAASNPTFIAPGGTVTEGAPTTTQVLVALKILIGDADIDKFLAVTRSKDQDLIAELIAMKARNFADTLADKFVYGSIAIDANEFDGLHVLTPAAQQVHAGAGAASGAGSLTVLDSLIDLVRPAPTALVMSRRSRRSIQTLMRSQGHDLALNQLAQFNKFVMFYNEVPILINDFLGIVETVAAGIFGVKTGGDASTIFALRLDEAGLLAFSADDPAAQDQLENIIQLESVGTLETKDANRWRLKSYLALGLKDTQAIARYDGINAAAWTN